MIANHPRCVPEPSNINTPEFWEQYLAEQWDKNNGRQQTRLFARYFLDTVELPADARTLLDVSCAFGDALDEIHQRYPILQLFGTDVSATAIEDAQSRYGHIARFRSAAFEDLTDDYDLIYCSNTLEHFENYLEISQHLLEHCQTLYVLVPFRELRNGQPLKVEPGEQHVVTFDRNSFDALIARGAARNIRHWICYTPGAWGWGKVPWWRKASARLLLRPPPVEYSQVFFEIESSRWPHRASR